MSQKPETLFRQRVMRDLKTLPLTAIFPIQQRSIIGDPDIILCMVGLFIALELKSKMGKASKLQEHKLQAVRNACGVSFLVFPDNWDEVFLSLRHLSQRNANDPDY